MIQHQSIYPLAPIVDGRASRGKDKGRVRVRVPRIGVLDTVLKTAPTLHH